MSLIGQFPCGGKPEEEKTVTAGTSAVTVTPTSGKTIKKVTVNPTPSETKTVTPSTSTQIVTPTNGKLLSSVKVNGITGVSGVTIDGVAYNGSALSLTSKSNVWAMMSAMKVSGTYDIHAVVLNGNIHVIGIPDSNGYKKAHYRWNGTSWETLTSAPYTMDDCTAVVECNGKIHLIGAKDSTVHAVWDGSSWSTSAAPRLPYNVGSGGIAAVSYNGELHVIYHTTATTLKRHHYKLTDSKWVTASEPPFFSDSTAVVRNNEIHLVGSSTSGETNYHYRWNGSTWTSVSTLPYKFNNKGEVIVVNNEIHILGGFQSANSQSHYKWNGSSWTSVSNLPYDFDYGAAVVLNGEIHIIGGGASVSDTNNHFVLIPTMYRKDV